MYNDTIPNACGADSILTIDLTIGDVDVGTSVSGITISADAAGATYQWIDCSDDSPVAGESSQDFTPTSNGSYAVEITSNTCTDTSACVNVVGVGIEMIDNKNNIAIYPNPTTGNLTIDLMEAHEDVTIEINNVMGQVVQQLTYATTQRINLDLKTNGMYFIKVKTSTGIKTTARVIKK